MNRENFEKEISYTQKNIQQLNAILEGNIKSLDKAKELNYTKEKLNDSGELDSISKLQSNIEINEKEVSYKHQQTTLAMEQIKLNIRKGVCE